MKKITAIALLLSLMAASISVHADPQLTIDLNSVLYFECVHEKIHLNKKGDVVVDETEVYDTTTDFFGHCKTYISNEISNISMPASYRSSVIWEGSEGSWGIPYPQKPHQESAHNPSCKFGLNPVYQ